MIRKTNTFNKPKFTENFWRRRPSEIKGYNRTIYTTTETNEYLRVDFNLQEKRVRLYLEDNEEGGNPYYSVITNGKVTVERNATTGRISDLYDKFSKRADVFSTIPNKDVVRLINNNYNIGIVVKKRNNSKEEINTGKAVPKTQLIKEYIPTYARDADNNKVTGTRKKKNRIGFIDIIDSIVGITLCAGLFLYNRSFVTLGVLSAFIGIFMGLLDVYYRERYPVFIKMILFLLAGVISYVYGYYIL
jgi:hypothetical protein